MDANKVLDEVFSYKSAVFLLFANAVGLAMAVFGNWNNSEVLFYY